MINMDENQRWEEPEKRREEERESLRRKKIQVREKVGKSRNTVFFQWFVAPEGPQVGSLKRRVRSHLARWEMKNCTPLWREALSKSKCTKHTMLGPLLKVAMSKRCTPLWREAHNEEVSQNCFVFDVVKCKNGGSLAELLRFWCCQVQTAEEVSQNSFVLNGAKYQNWGSLAELLRFGCCQGQKLRKCRKIAAFSSLQVDR